MELSIDFPAYSKPVDIWILLALPDNRFYLADESGNLHNIESSGFIPIASGVSGTKTEKTILAPFKIGTSGTSFAPWPKDGSWTAYWLVAPESDGDILKALENGDYELGFYVFSVISDEGFEYGTPKSYNLSSKAGTSIQDSITGDIFIFPDGADGTLIVTPINIAPGADTDDSGYGFQVEYTGTEAVHYSISYNDGEYPALWVWGKPDMNVYEYPSLNGMWMPVSKVNNDLNNTAVFAITTNNLSANFAVSNKIRKKPLYSAKIWKKKLNEAEWYNKKSVFESEIKSVLTQVIDLLPEDIQNRVKTEIDGRLNAYIYPTAQSGMYERSQYRPFDWLTGTIDPTFLFGSLAEQRTVVHETGHYISHVLGGDTVMQILKEQALGEHGVGNFHAGRPMLEEYAYFTEYTILKEIGGVKKLDMSILSLSPASKDTPSIEGYAVRLLALMLKDNSAELLSKDSSLSGEDEDIPMINASLQDIWKILAETPVTVDELYTKIYNYLSEKGEIEKLPPFLERTGWSYNGEGKVVDSQGNGISGVMVQSVAKVSSNGISREYKAPLKPVFTDKDGKFIFDRIFPGNSVIRVKKSETSEEYMDFPLKTDIKKATNVKIDLGKLNFSVEESCYLREDMFFDSYNASVRVNFKSCNEFQSLQWDIPLCFQLGPNGTIIPDDYCSQGGNDYIQESLTGSWSCNSINLSFITSVSSQIDPPGAGCWGACVNTDVKFSGTATISADSNYNMVSNGSGNLSQTYTYTTSCCPTKTPGTETCEKTFATQ